MFREVNLVGSCAEIGFQRGSQLKAEIEEVPEYYLSVFNLPERDALQRVNGHAFSSLLGPAVFELGVCA